MLFKTQWIYPEMISQCLKVPPYDFSQGQMLLRNRLKTWHENKLIGRCHNYFWRPNLRGWMDEGCFRPLFCTIKAELGQGQPGLMRWRDETLPQCSIHRSTLHTAAHRATSELAAVPQIHGEIGKWSIEPSECNTILRAEEAVKKRIEKKRKKSCRQGVAKGRGSGHHVWYWHNPAEMS